MVDRGGLPLAVVLTGANVHDSKGLVNFGRRLKTLKGLTPYEAICRAWTKEPGRFTSDPTHQIPGPNI